MKQFNIIGAIACILLTATFKLHAQKLVRVQKEGLRAPYNVKIDGKLTEWNNTLKAYNRSTEIFYSIANDDNKLYLIVHATKPDIINKIIRGSVTFTINHTSKKRDNKAVSITFPLLSKDVSQYIGNIVKYKEVNGKEQVGVKQRNDSLMSRVNQQLVAQAKEILIKGIPAIDDSLISVYNLTGIKAAAIFNNKLTYTCELAIPLKYLGINEQNFSYHVTLNGTHNDVSSVDISGITSMTVGEDKTITIEGSAAEQYNFLNSPTDFWGEYTLVKR